MTCYLPTLCQAGQLFYSLFYVLSSLNSALSSVSVFSGGHEFLIIVKEKKMGCIVKMFRFLSSRNNPGVTKEKILNYSFGIGIELA